jgi:hypothetical protein
MSNLRKLINIKVLGASQKNLDEFVNENKSFLFKETYVGIKQAIRRNKLLAEICNVNTNSTTIVIGKEHWESALSSSLGYYESNDEFEICKEISSTLKLLRNENRPLRLTKTISGSVIAS